MLSKQTLDLGYSILWLSVELWKFSIRPASLSNDVLQHDCPRSIQNNNILCVELGFHITCSPLSNRNKLPSPVLHTRSILTIWWFACAVGIDDFSFPLYKRTAFKLSLLLSTNNRRQSSPNKRGMSLQKYLCYENKE